MDKRSSNIELTAMTCRYAVQSDTVMCFKVFISSSLISVLFWKPLCKTVIVHENGVWVFVPTWAFNHVARTNFRRLESSCGGISVMMRFSTCSRPRNVSLPAFFTKTIQCELVKHLFWNSTTGTWTTPLPKISLSMNFLIM